MPRVSNRGAAEVGNQEKRIREKVTWGKCMAVPVRGPEVCEER